MDNQLPAEWQQKLTDEALKLFPEQWHHVQSDLSTDLNAYPRHLWLEGATEYASNLHQVEQEIVQLKQWRKAQLALLSPILDYGQSKEAGIPLGKSITNAVLERCKSFSALQAKFDKYEAALKVNYEPGFIDYVRNERNSITKEMLSDEWWLNIPASKRVAFENVLIVYDQMMERLAKLGGTIANEALSAGEDRICPNCNKVFNGDRHGNCRECGSDEYTNNNKL